jgi:hypothetical protein
MCIIGWFYPMQGTTQKISEREKIASHATHQETQDCPEITKEWNGQQVNREKKEKRFKDPGW